MQVRELIFNHLHHLIWESDSNYRNLTLILHLDPDFKYLNTDTKEM